MGKVTAGVTVSLGGYIAGPDETGFEHLFAWFDGGDLEFPFVTTGSRPPSSRPARSPAIETSW